MIFVGRFNVTRVASWTNVDGMQMTIDSSGPLTGAADDCGFVIATWRGGREFAPDRLVRLYRQHSYVGAPNDRRCAGHID